MFPKKVFLTILLLILLIINGFSQGVAFKEVINKTYYDSLSNYAKKINRPVCLYIYSPECPGCLDMNRRVFSDTRLAATFNLTFLNLKINFESEFGHLMVERYAFQQLPAILFTDPAGHNLAKIYDASVNAESLRQIGISIAAQYYDMLSLRDSVETKKVSEPQTLKQYAFLLTRLNYFDEGARIAEKYFNQSLVFDFDPYEWFLIQSYLSDISHPVFLQFLNNKTRFQEIYGKDNVDQYLSYVFETNLVNAINRRDTILLNKTLSILDFLDYRKMSEQGISRESAKLFFKIEYYRAIKNWNLFAVSVETFFSTAYVPDELARDYIIDFYYFINEPSWISKADSWAKKNYQKNKSFDNTIAYACTRFKSGDSKKAARLMKKARKLISSAEQKTLFDKILAGMN